MSNLTAEYEALRDEMTQRVETIHQTLLAGVGAALAAIAFGLTQMPESAGARPSQLACVIQVLLFFLGFYILEQYWVLYRLGTYLAFAYEGSGLGSARWHRMSRHFSDWQKQRCRPRWFWEAWGTGAKLVGGTLFVLTLVNLGALVWLRARWVGLSPAAISFETLAVVLGAFTAVPIRLLVWGVKGYLDRVEADWRQYHTEFESSQFAHRYTGDAPDASAAPRCNHAAVGVEAVPESARRAESSGELKSGSATLPERPRQGPDSDSGRG